jgi:dihydroflavonol-4-reductase
MNKQNCISITGGTGHLGTGLIQLLLEKGFHVKALHYNSKPRIEHPNLKWIKGKVTDSNCIRNLITDSTVLVHSAAVISIGDKNRNLVFDTNVNGTKAVIKICSEDNIKFIYMSSSTAVKETIGTEIFDENRPYKTEKDFLYGYTKALSEQLIIKAIAQHKLHGHIIRPTSIIGPPDYNVSHFGQTILDMHSGKIPAITTGGYNLVDVRDLSQTIINSFSLGENGAIYLVGGHYYSLKDIAHMANPDKKPLNIPLDILIVLAPLISLIDKIVSMKWPVTKESLLLLKRAPKNVDSTKAIKKLKHQCRPTQESITDLISWHKKQPLHEA